MQNTSRTSMLDSEIVAAWQEQIAAARQRPGLLPEIMRRRDELLPRFAAHYTYLRALPRRARRTLQRHWHLPLAGVALMLALGQSPALAATIPVNASCTLIDAITAANTDTATGGCPAGSGVDTIVLPPGSTQTLTTVNNSTHGPTGLPVIGSAITIEGQGSTIRRSSGAPDFRIVAVNGTGDLTLQETTVGGGVTSAGGRGGGVANYGGTLTLLNSIIASNTAVCYQGSYYYNCYGGHSGGVFNAGGALTVTNSTISGNESFSAAGGGGGGVFNSGGTVTMTNSIISGNFANYGGGGGIANMGIGTVAMSTIVGNFSYYGGGVRNGGTLTITNSTIANNDGYVRGGGVSNYGILTVTNSIIVGNCGCSQYGSGGGGVDNSGTLTITNSTISGNTASDNIGASYGGGVANYGGTLTVLNSTISGNSARGSRGVGGGVFNEASVRVGNSTISGNYARIYAGGVFNGYGTTLTLVNSTVTGNSSTGIFDRGSIVNYGILTLARTLVAGNNSFAGPEIFNYVSSGSVLADNHNLFGVNGNAGVVGFTPGLTDVVPPVGVQLTNILNPVLAFNGGPTQTHALVPGSPAIDAGGPVCTDANGNPLLTDQRGKPRIIDGNRDGTARCDIGAFEFFPVVNNLVTLDPALDTSFNPTPVPNAPAGSFTITATFTNTSNRALRFPFFTVTELSGGNLLLNADEGTQGVGATVTPNVGDQVLSPGETVQVDFVIGLQTSRPFTFLVDLFAAPLVSGAATSRHRPTVTTKGGRR